MSLTFVLVGSIVVIALLFDFFNGFHDAANAIATIVMSKTLRPGQAVLLAGVANFIGYFTFGVAVANTIGKGVVLLQYITLPVIIAALVGAIIWNIITWLLGLPTSSSHALIGGLVGAAVAASGFGAIMLQGIFTIVSFIVIAPLLGWAGAAVFTIVIINLFKKSRPDKAKGIFKKLQLVSAMAYAMGHGTNDAQKSMGVIAMALVAGGFSQSFKIEPWIVIACYGAISLGTMFGGWRIVKTMGTQIINIQPMEGFCAETSSAVVLLLTAHFGIPVSTTHVIAGSIMGVGTVEQAASVRWITARKIMWAWLLTIPLTAICSAIVYSLISIILSFVH
jgi:inorganic phosphate transporter, PiT family